MAILENANTNIINARKFDGNLHRTWNAELISQNNSLLSFVGKFEKEVSHPFLGVIGRDTISYEFFWFDRWYNVFRFHEPNGNFRNFYCNVNMPPTFDGEILDYIDLDVDILVWKNFSYQVLDLDEFEDNSRKYSYPEDLRERVQASLRELIFMIENRIFPFDYEF